MKQLHAPETNKRLSSDALYTRGMLTMAFGFGFAGTVLLVAFLIKALSGTS